MDEITRKQMEKWIRMAMEDVYSDYRKYNPTGDYLAMTISVSDGVVRYSAFNCDEEHPIDFYHWGERVDGKEESA